MSYSDERVFQSTDTRTVLVELYTSQGCSSCPPAERYLNKLSAHPDLWKTFIPVSFHVDYWDYIGWKDVFSKSEYTKRQRKYASVRGARTIYTPAIYLDGQTSSAWRGGASIKPSNQNVGTLRVSITDDSIQGEFSASEKSNRAYVYNIAYVGMNIKTDIKAGENDGEVLAQDFVVLKQVSVATGNWKTKMYQNIDGFKVDAIVAWISVGDDPTPIQAVGGIL